MVQSATSLNVETLRVDFPILQREVNGHPLVYLDNAATTQKPQTVIDALVDYYTRTNANIHRGLHTLAEEATSAYEEVRTKTATFINAASHREVVFTRNTTESLNLLAYTLGARLQLAEAPLLVVAGDDGRGGPVQHHHGGAAVDGAARWSPPAAR